MRISSALIATLALAACSGGSDGNIGAPGGPDAEHIACATGGSDDFARDCILDRSATDRGTVLTVHQPDGGFHRLLITTDGHGVVAADGADHAEVTVLDKDRIEVAIGDARYRLPATVGPMPAE